MKDEQQLAMLTEEMKQCQDVLLAVGDATRQSILMTLISAGCETGMRVGEITSKTHLSRPAVSHHIKVLKEAGVVNVRREGTMNFYYIDPDNHSLNKIKILIEHMNDYIAWHNENIEQKGEQYV